MILDERGLYFWNMDTGEKRWQMEVGLIQRVWLLWLYGGLTEGYSSVSALGSTVDACSATVGV